MRTSRCHSGPGVALLVAMEPPHVVNVPPLEFFKRPLPSLRAQECGPQLTIRPRGGKPIEVLVPSLLGAVVAAKSLQMMSWTPGTETPRLPTRTPRPSSTTPFHRILPKRVIFHRALPNRKIFCRALPERRIFYRTLPGRRIFRLPKRRIFHRALPLRRIFCPTPSSLLFRGRRGTRRPPPARVKILKVLFVLAYIAVVVGMIEVLWAPVLMRVVVDHQFFQPFFLETILRRETLQTVTLLIRALVSPRYQ